MPHFGDGTSPSHMKKVQVVSDDAEARAARIRTKNRRKRYLDLHPEYFSGSNLELADPLLYDRLVRRFLTTEEREKEGRERGYTGSMEADFVRSEAKLDALRHPDPNSPMTYQRSGDGSIVGVEADSVERVGSKEEGLERWRDVMGQRFLRGDDAEFEYAEVDENEDYEDREEEDRTKLDEYLGQQDAEFLGDGTPKGETGVQDF